MLYFWKLYRSHCSSKFMSTHSYTHTAVELQPDLPTVYTTSPCVAATMLATHSLLPWSVEQLWAWPNLTRICGVEHAARLFLGPKSWGEHHCQRAQVGLRLGTSMCNLSFLHLLDWILKKRGLIISFKSVHFTFLSTGKISNALVIFLKETSSISLSGFFVEWILEFSFCRTEPTLWFDEFFLVL